MLAGSQQVAEVSRPWKRRLEKESAIGFSGVDEMTDNAPTYDELARAIQSAKTHKELDATGRKVVRVVAEHLMESWKVWQLIDAGRVRRQMIAAKVEM